jgi:hypothetical protein
VIAVKESFTVEPAWKVLRDGVEIARGGSRVTPNQMSHQTIVFLLFFLIV